MGVGDYTLAVPFYHPAHRYFRFLFLAMLCFMTFGSYWCYDIPDALQGLLKTQYNLSGTEYASLYSVYNFMNIGIVLFGGYFIDMIGLRIGAILFCMLITLGQLVFSFGSNFHNTSTAYGVMLAGRIIFSLGGESLSVAQSAFAAKWFKGNELALAFGITLSFSRIGSFANLNVTPTIANHWGVSWAIWLGSITCLVSFALTIFASVADRIRDRKIKSDEPEKKEKPKIPFRLSDIGHFPLSLWIIYFICVCYYVPIFTLISISGFPYLKAMDTSYSDTKTNHLLSIPYIMSAVLAPLCGFLADRIGRKPFLLAFASGLMVASFAVLLFVLEPSYKYTHEDTFTHIVILAMALLGLSYSLCASSLWPCVPLLVVEERVGTAYAIMNAIQNAGLALAATFAGWLSTSCQHGEVNYNHVQCSTRPIKFLFIVALVATAFAILLFFWDLGNGKVLNKRSVKIEEEKAPLLAKDSINT